jgi:hypothetical protein
VNIEGTGRLCCICGDPAEFACDYRQERRRRLGVKRVRRGDLVITRRDEIEPAAHWLVTAVTMLFSPWRRDSLLMAWFTLKGDCGTGEIKPKTRGSLRVIRREPCGAAVCYRHVREIDDNVHWCSRCAEAAAEVVN